MAEADRTGWLVATPQGEAGRRIGRRKDDGEKRADRSIWSENSAEADGYGL